MVGTAFAPSFRPCAIALRHVLAVRILGKRGGRLAHVELAGHDIGDKAGAVFVEIPQM